MQGALCRRKGEFWSECCKYRLDIMSFLFWRIYIYILVVIILVVNDQKRSHFTSPNKQINLLVWIMMQLFCKLQIMQGKDHIGYILTWINCLSCQSALICNPGVWMVSARTGAMAQAAGLLATSWHQLYSRCSSSPGSLGVQVHGGTNSLVNCEMHPLYPWQGRSIVSRWLWCASVHLNCQSRGWLRGASFYSDHHVGQLRMTI